jgi:23S rRNA (cytosine1962-C5)-methyltransferase
VNVRVYLRRDARRVARERQSWIRRDRIQRIQGPADPALLAQILDDRHRPLGWGLYSPDSDIRIRVLAWQADPLSPEWLDHRIAAALARRRDLGLDASEPDARSSGYREVNSEGDGLPGLVVDRYAHHRVLQITTAAMAARQDELVAAFSKLSPHATPLVLRPEGAAAREGFDPGFDGPRLDAMNYREHGVEFSVPGPPTQKTGGYHDQRENRRRVAQLAAAGPGPLLDLGSHVGGFSVHAASLGVDCVAVDSSAHMLEFVERNARAVPGEVRALRADMFGALDEDGLQGPFGTIVFDPPKIASKVQDRGRASRATQRSLTRLLPRLATGGHLVVCSCSHHFGRDAMHASTLASADATGRKLSLVEERGPGPDHPVREGHAEGQYLRVNIYRVD